MEDGIQRTGHVVIELLQLELPARDLVADHGQVVDLRRRRARRNGPLQVLELRLPCAHRIEQKAYTIAIRDALGCPHAVSFIDEERDTVVTSARACCHCWFRAVTADYLAQTEHEET